MGCCSSDIQVDSQSTRSNTKPARQKSQKEQAQDIVVLEETTQLQEQPTHSANISTMEAEVSSGSFEYIYEEPGLANSQQSIILNQETMQHKLESTQTQTDIGLAQDKSMQVTQFFTKELIINISCTFTIISTESQVNLLSDAIMKFVNSFAKETPHSLILHAFFPQIPKATIFALLKHLQSFHTSFLFCFFAIKSGIHNARACSENRMKELIDMLPGGNQGPENNLLAINEAPTWVYEILGKTTFNRIDLSQTTGLKNTIHSKNQMQLIWNIIDIHSANKMSCDKVQKVVLELTGENLWFGKGFVTLQKYKSIMSKQFFETD